MKEGYVVPTIEKIAYGLGDLAINIAYTTIGFYFLFFLVNVAGLPAQWAGIIFFIARAWDAITDPLMGMISDRTKSKYGRRRVYFLFGCIPFGLMFMLIWLVPSHDHYILLGYYAAITILFNTAFTVVAVPYNALMPELSQNYDERTSISGFRMSLSFVGNLIAAVGVSVIVDVVFKGKEHYITSYPVMGVIFGIIIIVLIFITFVGTKERVQSEAVIHDGLLKTFKAVLSLHEFRIILGMFLFNMIGFDLIQALFIFFLKDVILIEEDMTFVVMGIPLIVAVLSAPLWIYISDKLDKRRAYMVAAIYFTLSLLLCLIAPVHNLQFVIIIGVLAGVGISASQIIPFSMIPDVIEYDEYKNGVRREGAFYGITTFLYKVASASAIALASAFLAFFGYIENSATAQPQSAVSAIRYMMAFAPGLCFLISVYFVSILPITREGFDEIKRILNERKSIANNG
ncbi:MAG TPA: MFS transporter [Spirochaetota bacterium]|nr:MFS transporter [Spirochaetota bacterium]HPP49388.1 MFS transporter [Spirochaetota bacterium]HXK64919.1 MFS transporter [Spirochaetota bacterium]